MKKAHAWIRYYSRTVLKRSGIYASYLLFVLALLLFFIVLVPSSCLRRTPLLSGWPKMLDLNGVIEVRTNIRENESSNFLAGATVKIGGYKTTTDEQGRFHLRFASTVSQGIPIVVEYFKKATLLDVSFPKGEFTKEQVFHIEQKSIY